MRPTALSTAASIALVVGLATTTARADDFVNQEGGLWRASKLVGVDLFGPGDQKVGAISDVLMDKDGKAAYVVVGVGGFLGIGQKDVAIPFGKVKWSQEPMAEPAPPAGAPSTSGTVRPMSNPAPGAMSAPAANTGMAPNSSVGLGSPVTTNGAGGAAPTRGSAAGAAMTTPVSPRSSAYPDHGMIDYTADQLKSAPTFTYAK